MDVTAFFDPVFFDFFLLSSCFGWFVSGGLTALWNPRDWTWGVLALYGNFPM
jgi:hypothetical protein